MELEFRLLGPLEVAVGGRALPLGGRQQRALLALLLLHANEVVATDRLIDELWGESPPATVHKIVQLYVSRLRKQLGDGVIVTRPPGYVLRADPAQLDLARFQRLVTEAGAADHDTAGRKLREALSLWRGPPLADLAYEPFAQAEIARLDELRLTAVEQRVEAELATGRHAELVAELEALARRHPVRERLRGQLMLALYRCGRQGDALATYRAARRALVDGLGIEPGRELRELHEAILQQDPALDLTAPAGPAALPRGAFVGRTGELAELAGGLDDAFAGRVRVFLLAGEPGIGKSRLAEELIAQAVIRGARVLAGRCWEAGGAPAYWPWMQSLRTYVREGDDAVLRRHVGPGGAHLAQILPELRERFPDVGDAPLLDPEAARFRLFDAVAEFLRRAAEQRPLVLWLDDLHAADAPSLLLLQFVARQLRAARVLLIAAHRDVDPVPGEALVEALAELAREPVTRRIALRGLSRREVSEYVEITAAGIATPALVETLREETEGNPLFVSEIVRLLVVEGVGEPGRVAVPQSVRDVIARRLAHLSDGCNRVLTLASMLGREFSMGSLVDLTELDEDELLDRLDEAMAARVIGEVPSAPGRLRFSHVLIRDTLYERMTPARRARLHRMVVETIERRHARELGPHLAELAHHAIAGRDAAKGLTYVRGAGARALASLAYEEAARQYRAAIAALDLDERTRCELLLAIADAESCAGNTARARSALLETAGIARRNGLAQELALAAAEYGGRVVFSRASEDDLILPLLEEALAALPPNLAGLRSRLLARLAAALRDEPSPVRREALSREAVELARRDGDAATLAYALDGRAITIIAPDTLHEVIAIGTELLELAERLGDREQVVHGHMHRMGPLIMIGEIEQAKAGLDAATRAAEDLQQPPHLWDVAGAHAMLALAEGPLDEAEKAVAEALALGEPVQPAMAIPVHRIQRHGLLDFRGGLAEIEPGIQELVEMYPARPVFRCVLAHVHARLGWTEEAGRALGELAADRCAALPFDQEWLFGMSLLAEACSTIEDARTAAVLYELLLPWSELNAVDQCEGVRGSVGRYLGLLAGSMHRWDEAGHHFESALGMNARLGARPWLALTRRDYARALLARDAPGDRRRAEQLAAAALAGFRELGMDGYA